MLRGSSESRLGRREIRKLGCKCVQEPEIVEHKCWNPRGSTIHCNRTYVFYSDLSNKSLNTKNVQGNNSLNKSLNSTQSLNTTCVQGFVATKALVFYIYLNNTSLSKTCARKQILEHILEQHAVLERKMCSRTRCNHNTSFLFTMLWTPHP